jgi:hypothetical protein
LLERVTQILENWPHVFDHPRTASSICISMANSV